MRKIPVIFGLLFAVLILGVHNPARAQAGSPQQIQGLIANGQEQTALSELQSVLQAHPDSGVGWYLTAEAQDASGNEAAARSALASAQHYAPGLPFAQASDVSALQAHLAGNPSASGGAMTPRHSGISPTLIGVIGLVILFLVMRMFFRRRRAVGPSYYPSGYGQPGGPGPGFGGPGPGYGPGGGMGSGLGGALMGGLAAGAGLAAV